MHKSNQSSGAHFHPPTHIHSTYIGNTTTCTCIYSNYKIVYSSSKSGLWTQIFAIFPINAGPGGLLSQLVVRDARQGYLVTALKSVKEVGPSWPVYHVLGVDFFYLAKLISKFFRTHSSPSKGDDIFATDNDSMRLGALSHKSLNPQ